MPAATSRLSKDAFAFSDLEPPIVASVVSVFGSSVNLISTSFLTSTASAC